MHYRVTFLAAHARTSRRVYAPSAASAVVRVQHATGHHPNSFELISVVPDRNVDVTVTEVLDPGDVDETRVIA